MLGNCDRNESGEAISRVFLTLELQKSSFKFVKFVLGLLTSQTENVFNCLRHQRLVTVAFRLCVQIFWLTFLLTYLLIYLLTYMLNSCCKSGSLEVMNVCLLKLHYHLVFSWTYKWSHLHN